MPNAKYHKIDKKTKEELKTVSKNVDQLVIETLREENRNLVAKLDSAKEKYEHLASSIAKFLSNFRYSVIYDMFEFPGKNVRELGFDIKTLGFTEESEKNRKYEPNKS